MAEMVLMEEMMKKKSTTDIVIISMTQLIGIQTGYKNQLNQRIVPIKIPDGTMKSITKCPKEV